MVEPSHPRIVKLGTIACDTVETTPLVWRGRLYRFEYVRPGDRHNATGNSYLHLVDLVTGQPTPPFGQGYHLASAYSTGERVYVYAPPIWGASTLRVFWSDDLVHWESALALDVPGWGIYNTAVCRDPQGYLMAIELGEPPELVGERFTMLFARSGNLLDWEVLSPEHVYAREKYTACPAMRWLDGWYYMVYLAHEPPGFNPYIVRSRDLVTWEASPFNPIMHYQPDVDRRIANPALSTEDCAAIAVAVNINNSDVDFCEFEGRVVLYYSWGNQEGIEFLAEAYYEGTEADFLRGFFPA